MIPSSDTFPSYAAESYITLRVRRLSPLSLRTMSHPFRTLFAILALLVSAHAAYAQGQFSPIKELHPGIFSVRANFGMTLYSGDIDHGAMFPDADHKWDIGADLYAQVKLFKLGSFMTGSLLAYFSYSPQKAMSSDYEFQTSVFNMPGIRNLEFFNRVPLRPFVAGGFGAAFFEPNVTYMSPRIAGQVAQYQRDEKMALLVPIMIGIHWTVTRNLDITYTFVKTLSLNDNLDGWVAKDNDNYQAISIGAIWYF